MATLREIQQSIDSNSTVLTIGNFDGVHLGHQSIFGSVTEIAKARDASSVALVLFPHPKEIFTGSSPALLTPLDQRLQLIRDMGLDHVFHLQFDHELSKQTVHQILDFFQDSLKMDHLVIGPTTHIGKNREGIPSKIREISETKPFGLTIAQEKEVQGSKVSSSVIRNAIGRGNMRHAAQLLGRYYATSGIVVSGMGKGRVIGYPTANLSKIQTMVPARGVYAGYAYVEGQKYKAAVNVGTRPTLTDDQKIVVEPHIIDFDQSILGKSLEVHWVERLREEVRFSSPDQLKIQIGNDIRKVMDML